MSRLAIPGVVSADFRSPVRNYVQAKPLRTMLSESCRMIEAHRLANEDRARSRRAYLRRLSSRARPTTVCSAPNRAGLRRDYLRTQLQYYCALSCTLIGICMLVWTSIGATSDAQLALVICAGVIAVVVLYQVLQITASAKAAAVRCYAPPVEVRRLPVAEVLVRASDKPCSAPRELLRAAHTGAGATTEELLRSTANR